jgi:peptide/nickel transport system substrate-binding protein
MLRVFCRKPLRAALLPGAAAVFLAACGSSGSGGSGANGASTHHPVITAAYTAPVTTIDPGSACDIPSYTTIQNLYDELVTTTGVTVQPMLASSWKANPNDTEYTFQLRHGATFSSGNPVTPADVVFSLHYALKQNGCEGYVLDSGFDNEVTSIKATGPDTVVVKLKTPDPIFLKTMSQQVVILDSKVVMAHGGNSKAGASWLSTHAAGSGPFTLTSYEPDNQIVLTARKNYWGGAPAPSKVVIRIVSDPSSMELLASSGAINMAFDVPLQDLPKVASNGNLKVISNPSQFYYNVGFNVKKAPLNDLRVRQALTYATPFNQIVQTYGYGYATGLVGPLLPVMPAAGVEGKSLTMVLQSGYPVEQDIATALQSAWKAVGIHLNVSIVPPSQFVNEVYNWKDQMYMIKDGPEGSVDPGFFMGYFVECGNTFNWSNYCNKTVDSELAKARTSPDESVSTPLYQQIARQVTNDAPYLMLLSLDHVVVTTKGLTGYTYYSDQATRFFHIA